MPLINNMNISRYSYSLQKKKTFNTPSKKSDEKLLTNETLSKPNIKFSTV